MFTLSALIGYQYFFFTLVLFMIVVTFEVPSRCLLILLIDCSLSMNFKVPSREKKIEYSGR